MVKHIVLFKLKETLSQDEKMVYMKRFKEAIEALPAVIPFIKKVFVGFNINADEKWDICLESEFDTLDELFEKSKKYTKGKWQCIYFSAEVEEEGGYYG